MDSKPTFWSTLPGILTALATLITAVAGLYSVVAKNPFWEPQAPSISQADSATEQTTSNIGHSGLAQPTTVVPDQPSASTPAHHDLAPLIDCQQAAFQLDNTRASLMSWSRRYQQQILEGREIRHSCEKALSYRGSAHCQAPDDSTLRQGLMETLKSCAEKGYPIERLFKA